MGRQDISNYLTHFTKGENDSIISAYARLKKIIQDRHLIGTKTVTKGSYNCVSFTETPLAFIKEISYYDNYYSNQDFYKYSPFGIMFTKKWIFEQSGRPVIYQPDEEFGQLPETHKWRHVRYEPNNNAQPIDFTWEREWRICCKSLKFSPKDAIIVLPNRTWEISLNFDLNTAQACVESLDEPLQWKTTYLSQTF